MLNQLSHHSSSTAQLVRVCVHVHVCPAYLARGRVPLLLPLALPLAEGAGDQVLAAIVRLAGQELPRLLARCTLPRCISRKGKERGVRIYMYMLMRDAEGRKKETSKVI